MLSINKGIWKSDILRSSITTNQHYLQQHQSQSPEFYTGCPIFPVRGTQLSSFYHQSFFKTLKY